MIHAALCEMQESDRVLMISCDKALKLHLPISDWNVNTHHAHYNKLHRIEIKRFGPGSGEQLVKFVQNVSGYDLVMLDRPSLLYASDPSSIFRLVSFLHFKGQAAPFRVFVGDVEAPGYLPNHLFRLADLGR